MNYQTVLDYWFGELPDKTYFPQEKFKVWFGDSVEIDNEIREKFEDILHIAKEGKLDHWKETARGWLALLIVLDQFPRNIYRRRPEMFAFDHINLKLCLEGLDKKIDEQLFPVERVFFYLPLEHDENLEIQKKSMHYFKKLWDQAPQELSKNMEMCYDYALKHYKMIERFGRYPYRNKLLGRTSTSEEIEYLKEPGSSFI
ncbi:DUF924 family protein [Candidatus Uabimicrobium sp. HlEnr_7]|uniref:DUF924 family protein n=1 Tax=Candidatus Uabimicrobium helgolandensis TaxID=3095367 RepID=UPI003558ABA3